ncbi:hypothetical protein F8M41_001829 [Gigaspora margarita]|uniref:Uncharacterized protein n=1 Tax=Gigaspora margarita TaxID=4874 RepID=A0A8H4AYW2_GIGMA|nr:hypothetical protein F8M41_001829 [Gigaspora margarita]
MLTWPDNIFDIEEDFDMDIEFDNTLDSILDASDGVGQVWETAAIANEWKNMKGEDIYNLQMALQHATQMERSQG